VRLGSALRDRLKQGYGPGDFRADLMSGTIVGLVAIPLGMALAIASGVPPQYGLYTVIMAGSVVALLGGSRWQVTGPTAAFVVILAPIAHKFGFPGLLVAGLMAGLFLIGMGMARLGQLIEYIPHPVTTGFTSGIAVVIATIQLKDFFGLRVAEMPERYLERVGALFHSIGTWSLTETATGAFTLAFLLVCSRRFKRIPAPLVVMTTVTAGVALLHGLFPGLEIATVGSRFPGGIPQAFPRLDWPWNFADPSGRPFELSLRMIEDLLPSGFAIAMLGAIESLLSAVVADGMADTRHDPDTELVALGVGNVLCPFIGGIAATGAIARTATNIRFGARSPVSAIVHALFTLLVVLLFAPLVSHLPMAALAALLLLVAWNMSEVRHFAYILRVGPRSDVITLLLCFGLTVTFDMVIGVTVGVVLAALLFMRRMASVTSGRILAPGHHAHAHHGLPNEALLYEIAGPLFFGAADNAVDAISEVRDDVRVVIFDLGDVPMMDVSGLVAFESAVSKLLRRGKTVLVAGARKQPLGVMTRSKSLKPKSGQVRFCATVQGAVEYSRKVLAGDAVQADDGV
jgi:SulP family sulfate permease